MKKNITFWFSTLFLLLGIGAFFYHVNTLNYIKHKNIQANIVNHPEKLPNSDAARLASFGFTNIAADIYWLQAIQYV